MLKVYFWLACLSTDTVIEPVAGFNPVTKTVYGHVYSSAKDANEHKANAIMVNNFFIFIPF